MKAFLALLNVNFRGLLLNTMGSSRRRNRSKSATGGGALILIAAIMVWVSVVWSNTLSSILAPVGGLDIMLSAMALIAMMLALFFTLYASQGTLFNTKDIDLVLSLPVPTYYVMLARMMALYLEIALIVECILIPSGVVYLMNGGGGGAGFMVLLVVMGLLLSFLPALVTLVFGYLISLAISRLRHKNLFNIIFSILLVVVLMAVIMFMNQGMESVAMNIDSARQALYSVLPPLAWVVRVLTGAGILYILPVIGICLVPFLLVSWLFSLNFKSLLTRLASHTLRSDYKIGALGASGSTQALFKKEARKFFGTPVYFLNTGITAIMVIVAAVVALFFRGVIQQFIAAVDMAGGGSFSSMISPIFLGVMLFFLLTIMPSAVSVSLEGKTLWILKEAPVGTGRIFFAKAGFGALLGMVTAVIAVPLVGVAFFLPLGDILGILVVCLLYAAMVGMMGLYTNLHFPRLDFENETVVIKQSASAMLSMLFCLIPVAMLVGLYLLFYFLGVGFGIFTLAAVVLLVLVDFFLYKRLNTKGRRLFAEL